MTVINIVRHSYFTSVLILMYQGTLSGVAIYSLHFF